jgi:hypothetical protein
MLKTIFFIGIILYFTSVGFAQTVFTSTALSTIYNVKISIDSCNTIDCSGHAKILITNKLTSFQQQLLVDEMKIYSDANETIQLQKGNILANNNASIVFEDFNFDGTQDIAIRNGNYCGYGFPSYDIYVYHSTKKKFVFSQDLTNLNLESLGLFDVDKKRKRLITSSKSGYTWHQTCEYIIVPKVGLQKVYELTTEAHEDEGLMYITTKTKVKGVWKTKLTKESLKTFYE